MRVIVAGAGLSGLTAAHALSRRRATVTMLDARERLGGRVLTHRDGFSDGEYGELGGEFVDADQREIRTLCDELGLRLTRVLHAGFTHRFKGDDGSYHVSRTRPWTELRALLAPLQGRPPSEIARISLREWLRRQHATTAQHSMVDALRGFFLADPDDLSVLPVVEQLRHGGSPAQAEMYRIDGGSERLAEALARASAARVLLSHRLVAIAQSADTVVATAVDERGNQHQLEGDAIIVTLPASALAAVSITPPLPDEQATAVRTLKYGCATKVLVQTAHQPFHGRARAFATDTALGSFWQGPGRVLTFLGGGAASAALRGRAANGGHALLSELCWLGTLQRPLGGGASREAAMASVSWEDDPFVRGGYAYVDPHFNPEHRALLGRRAGRIHFAGEHTSERWQGYMNGAVESGLRAARELR